MYEPLRDLLYHLGKDLNPESPPVTLATRKAQDVWTYLRPAYDAHAPNEKLFFNEIHLNDVL